MRLLLDTCIVYDWLMGALGDAELVAEVCGNGAIVSAVTVWEMAIKHALGKLLLPTTKIFDDIEAQGFSWLPVHPRHAEAVLGLDAHHRDPFDRLLVAQARCEGLRIVTYDVMLAAYLPSTRIVKTTGRSRV